MPKVSTVKSAGCSPLNCGSIIAVELEKTNPVDGEDEVAIW